MNAFNPTSLAIFFNLTIIEASPGRKPFLNNPLFVENYLCHMRYQAISTSITMLIAR